MGARLSGGERQRVGIARVMLLDPDVIVMDEPTSSLDVLHEKELLRTLQEACGDKLLLIVSHRPPPSRLRPDRQAGKWQGSGRKRRHEPMNKIQTPGRHPLSIPVKAGSP